MIVGTAVAVVWMFSNFVTTSQFEDFVVDEWYDSYYEMLDKVAHAESEGNVELALEFSRRLERIKAKICEADPEWERCKE